jgi:hypothetical protein
MKSRLSLLVAPLLMLATACATPPLPFRQVSLREHFAIAETEFASLQFYVSRRVVAHDVSAGTPGAGDVLIVPEQTAGVVKEVGSHWLRVAFEPGGDGVIFLARQGPRDSIYKLATRAEDGSQLAWVDAAGDPILRDGQRVYRVVEGADAFLLVDTDDFNELVARRAHATGAELER